LFAFNLLQILGFPWRSNFVRSNNGLRNLICAASSFCAPLLFIISFNCRSTSCFGSNAMSS
jgi:hypothetical protein